MIWCFNVQFEVVLRGNQIRYQHDHIINLKGSVYLEYDPPILCAGHRIVTTQYRASIN